MSLHSDEKFRPYLNELSRINDLLEKEDFAAAREACLRLNSACQAAGIRSSQVLRCLAIACDYAGDFEMAFQSIRESVSLDPVSIPAWQSFGVVVRRLRDSLTDSDRALDDPTTPKIYALLLSADEATTPCHLAMARYLHHAGRHHEALRLLEAVTVVSPNSAEAWALLATVARASGDAEAARRAETEAAVLGDGRMVPFTIPGRADA